jgi:hypothetical protein
VFRINTGASHDGKTVFYPGSEASVSAAAALGNDVCEYDAPSNPKQRKASVLQKRKDLV